MAAQIIQLDEGTINRIAAGEVVERPASVAKELIENSLDAGARRIVIQLEDGGRRLIRVTDDGSGMNPSDARMALQRHATSKIATADDLFNIRTLGFRGEGLPSIASVSKLELISKPRDSVEATRIVSHGGEVVENGVAGAASGTTIAVRDLFYNTPARLKFMKSTATELSHIVDLVVKYILAYPGVSFRLQQGAQDMLISPGSGDLPAAVGSVWGKDVARSLAQIEYAGTNVTLSGFVSPPHITRTSRGHQAFFVNRRPVRSRALPAALDEAYRALTPEKRYPIAVLLLEVPPDKVDVNVHPAKTEVRFHRTGEIFTAVHEGVRGALNRHGMMPSAFGKSLRPQAPAWGAPANLPQRFVQREGDFGSGGEQFQPMLQSEGRFGSSDAWFDVVPPSQALVDMEPTAAFPFADLLDGLKIVGQVRNTYIVCETVKGIILIDQHVAHERVLYELFSRNRAEGAVAMQALLDPVSVTVDKKAAVVLAEHLTEVERLGFQIEAFGQDAFLIRGVPAAIADSDYEATFRDIVDDLAATNLVRHQAVGREQLWITASCKQAVKAGDPLTHAEMDALIRQLAETNNPYLCPHGRPIAVTITNYELDRKFKRA